MSLFLAYLITSMVVGHSVPVGCMEIKGGRQGYYDKKVIWLSPLMCKYLGYPRGSTGQRFAVFVLVHESEHAKGIVNEHKAECAALVDIVKVIKGTRGMLPKNLGEWFLNFHNSQKKPYGGPCLKGSR